jgi:hypothetical protein
VTAAAGLSLAGAPDFAHYIPFLQAVSRKGDLASGIATVLTPAVAATLFIGAALAIIHCEFYLNTIQQIQTMFQGL